MAKKPRLTAAMKEKRLAFANAHRDWSVEEWGKVMWSDKSNFEVMRDQKTKRVRRPLGSNRFDKRYTRKVVKYPSKTMVWGCFSMKGRGGLAFLPPKTTMNGVRYLTILEDHMVPFMMRHKTSIFMQDGAPAHRVRPVKDMIAENGWKLLDWPGNYPDLNPIKNLWNFVKDNLEEDWITTVADLQAKIKHFWCIQLNNKNYLQKLVASMPRRMQAVIDVGGAPTKY